MKKTLVTGGAGYIGSHTVLALLEAGREVIVLDNFSNSSPQSLKRVSEITGKSLNLIEADLTDRQTLNKIFSENEDISSVIHFAALKAVGESTIEPLKYYRNNVSGSILLLDEMQKAGVKKLVFSSSCTVYGEPEKVPVSESFPVGKVSSPYGRTKYMMEGIIADFAASDTDFSCGVLRYFNPVGAHASGKIGEDPNGIPDNLVPFVCQVATGKLEKLRIFGNDYPTPDGTAIRDYLHVVDLADAHLKALDVLDSSEQGFVCNLGTGRGSSVLEVIAAFEKANDIEIPFEFASRRVGDVTEAWADPAFAKQFLGWKTKYGLEEMLADAWRWQSQNPNGYR
ncbi:MAG: UDP-glucose 4-epimerase GalE [Verrucomicrobia bacterium TMED60]|nr:MAG: UDP-glucose 4-epimerase GalE [Verrucomicrobia bacterium TMED60]